MLRLALALSLVAASTAAAAAAPCSTPPKNPTARVMAVTLSPDGLLAPSGAAEFPAVSKDGSTVVELFEDTEDFTGAPLSTLVFWSKSGRVLATFRLGGTAMGEPIRQHPVKTAAAANARLAKKRWRPLAVHGVCAATDDGEAVTLHLDGGVAVTFHADKQKLTRVIGKGPSRPLRAAFPAPGSAMMGRTGGCGDVIGIERAFGGKDIGVAVFVPRVNLGGDNCSGNGEAANAIAVPIR